MGIAAKNPYENDDELEGQEARAVDGPREVELTTIDHVGIAVADLDDALDHYRRVFGATVDFRERFDEDGVEVAAILIGDLYLHLLAATRDDSDVAVFVEEWGPGLHHVGYRVADAAAAAAQLADQGYEVVDDEPQPGPRGSRVAYVNPHEVDGTIIQLVEI